MNSIKDLKAGVNDNDAVNLNQLREHAFRNFASAHPVRENLEINNNKIFGLARGVDLNDAVPMNQMRK